MNLVSCYFFEGEACLVQQDRTIKHHLCVTVYYDRESLQRECMKNTDDTIVCSVLADIEHSDLPEHSAKNPVRFSEWAAGCILLMLPSTHDHGAFERDHAAGFPWIFRAWANQNDIVPDSEKISKVLFFVKTSANTYHVFQAHSQMQAGEFWRNLKAPFPNELVPELLTLPVHSDKSPVMISGTAARALVIEMLRFEDVKELAFLMATQQIS